MVSQIEYAALSAFVYNDQRGGGPAAEQNKLDLPQGWQELERLGFAVGDALNAINPFSFTGGAYRIARVTDNQLLITPTAGGDSITVKNWKQGDLGLALGDEGKVQEEPAPSSLYFGDQRAPLLGIEVSQEEIDASHPNYGVYDWSAVTWPPTGALLGGIAEVDFADVISAAGQSGAVKMFGFGGNDALAGGAGSATCFRPVSRAASSHCRGRHSRKPSAT